MRKQKRIISKTVMAFVFAFITSMNFGFGQTKSDLFDELIGAYQEIGEFNGSVLVAEQGKVIYKKGFGMANMEWNITNAPDTKHRLGSITKQFTAMLILQLASEGKLDLHAPITEVLPDYPKEHGDIITVHHLLTHTSGIPNYTSLPGFMENESMKPYSPSEFVQNFSKLDLEFTPGERFNYSNSGYFLLGVIVEELTDRTYEELLHDKIFKPLNMNDTGYDNHADILKKRATGYERNGKNYMNSRYLDMSIPYAAGSMYSTVEDLYLWDQALYTNELLPSDYMELYFKPYIQAFGETYYTYGWGVGQEMIGNTDDSLLVVSHGGGINGFNTIISRMTSENSLIVLLNNTGGAPLNEMTQAMRGILFGKAYDFPKKSLAYEILSIVNTDGIEAGITYYKTNKASEEYEVVEREMNEVGYQLMNENRFEEAVKIFKLNLDAYPESSNVYDSYAEALMNLGENDQAIVNYQKSVEMDPSNQNGIDMLKKLGVNTNDLEKEVIVSEEILDSYVGDYELAPGFILSISRVDNQLKGQATGQPMVDIFPKSNTDFYLKVVQAKITFNLDDHGKVVSLTLFQGGQEMTGKKLD